MQQSLHSERFPRPLLPCHNNDHYHHCVKRGLSYRYINPGTPLLLWSNFTLICGPVLCMTVSWAVTGDHGSLPSLSELAESAAKEDREAAFHLNHKIKHGFYYNFDNNFLYVQGYWMKMILFSRQIRFLLKKVRKSASPPRWESYWWENKKLQRLCASVVICSRQKFMSDVV